MIDGVMSFLSLFSFLFIYFFFLFQFDDFPHFVLQVTDPFFLLPLAYYLFLLVYLKKNSFQCLLIFEREPESTSGGGAERERETRNLKQAPSSELSAQHLTQGWNP